MSLNKPYPSPLNHNDHDNSPAIHLSIFLSPQPFAVPLPVTKPVASQINDAVSAFFHLRRLQLRVLSLDMTPSTSSPVFIRAILSLLGINLNMEMFLSSLFPCFHLFVHYDRCDEWFLHYNISHSYGLCF